MNEEDKLVACLSDSSASNRYTRQQLAELTGLDDRTIRQHMPRTDGFEEKPRLLIGKRVFGPGSKEKHCHRPDHNEKNERRKDGLTLSTRMGI